MPASTALPFAQLLLEQLPSLRKQGQSVQEIEPLAHLEYAEEQMLKEAALRKFWHHHRLPSSPEALLPSPKPRHYRTTTKRRVFAKGSRVVIGFKGGERDAALPVSLLEPEAHTAIYQLILQKLTSPPYRLLIPHLNHLIVRGSYQEFTVILSVDRLHAEIVRKLKLLGEHLKTGGLSVVSAFVLHDPTRSDYYLETHRPETGVSFKKLFGPDRLRLQLGDQRYLLGPTAFSQVNESMIPTMLQAARQLLLPQTQALPPNRGVRLLDLYCGYGLFAGHFANDFAEIVGVDYEQSAVEGAQQNARRNHSGESGGGAMRFVAGTITAAALPRLLPRVDPRLMEFVLLDPPRRGTADGVVQAIAGRKPARVLHIFCGVDVIPRQIKEWEESGYTVDRVIPLDMFPGTPNLEVLVMLTPAHSKGKEKR
ncbi:MAG: class I SAM-dependent RNA methyltransferase [Armatimonadetes bacterium]|nr:class I SAM-dependent RNA methyltransferase [Armatimonadota bacterium]